MFLKYPLSKDKVKWHKREYHRIPANSLTDSGYFLVGVAEDTFDLYIAFTNETNDQLWIEKASKLAVDPIQSSNFVKIGDAEEFNTAHNFFIKQGILDGPKRS